VNGALFANWVARVPAVKDAVGAGTGALGLALLGLAVGSLVTMPFAGRLCERIGSRRAVLLSGWATSAAVVGPALARSPLVLALALVVYGGVFGLLDVAMNVQAVAAVRRVGRPIMAWFHAAFSFGGLCGAATGAAAAHAGLAPAGHLLLVGVAAAAIVLWARRRLLADAPTAVGATRPPSDRRRPHPRRARLLLVGLGAVAACAAVGEGAMADWTALFLRDVRGVGDGFAALGYAAFAVAMTTGRLAGEAAIRRAGPGRVLRIGGTTAAAGIALAVVVGSPAAALAGFAMVGLRLSCAFPLAFTAAGAASPGSGGSEIAAVSVIGYLGFLLGPPTLGLLADHVGLRLALLAVAAPAGALTVLARVVDVAGEPAPSAAPADEVPADELVAPCTGAAVGARAS
jgi:predicted MFS family arabinose efflux permease